MAFNTGLIVLKLSVPLGTPRAISESLFYEVSEESRVVTIEIVRIKRSLLSILVMHIVPEYFKATIPHMVV